MSGHFDQHGFRFDYPENWRVEHEETDSGWTVHVQSPNTAFLFISVDQNLPNIENMLQTTLETMKGDYPDLEAEDRVETLAGQPAVGHDMRFTSLDLTNTCCTRSFSTGDGTVLVLWQATDLDMKDAGPVLRAICSSLSVSE